MTREQQLQFCSICLNRKMDMQQGLICSLTGQKAAFENECPDYANDENAKGLPTYESDDAGNGVLTEKLSPEIFEKLKLEQNLVAGIVAGLVVGIIGAVLWGAITLMTNYQIGYLAIAIGALVGFSVRKSGKGIDAAFGFWGAGVSLFSVLLGNFLSIIGFIANYENLGYFETLVIFDFAYLPQVMIESFSPIDLIFYGMAAYAGYHYSFRKVTEKTIMNLHQDEYVRA